MRLLLSILTVLTLWSCSSSKTANPLAVYHQKQIQCIGKDHENNQSYYVWVQAKDKKQASLKAANLSLEHLLFKSDANQANCQGVALLPGANSQVNNTAYFTKFFSKNKTYRKYSTTRLLEQTKIKTNGNEKLLNYRYKVTLQTNKIKKQLKKDKLNDY